MKKKPLLGAPEAKRLADAHGTPLYVYRKSTVKANYLRLMKAIPYARKTVYYACKANANPEILKLLKGIGASIETVSEGEVKLARKAGFPANRISFTCSNISKSELKSFMKMGIHIHLDSLNQIEWWGQMRPNSKISIRVNTGLGAGHHSHVITGGPESKFGIYHTDLAATRSIAKKYGLTIVGLHQHIGSNILTPDTFIRAMKLLLDCTSSFPDLEGLDFGGGLGIPYRPEEKSLDVAKLGKKMSAVFSNFCKKYGRELELSIEPGRYIVADAGCLLATVTDIKKTPGHTFVGVNTGFNHLVRPMMYSSYHHIFNLSNPRANMKAVTVAGNICESGDVFAKNRLIPNPEIGDILLFADTGAYGYAMSSNYNARPKPKEIVIE